LVLLFSGGIGFPVVSAGAGLAWMAGKFLYAQGYSTGDPAKRMRGAVAYLGLLTLLYTSGMTAYKLLNKRKVLRLDDNGIAISVGSFYIKLIGKHMCVAYCMFVYTALIMSNMDWLPSVVGCKT
jgi:hypothetical protein